MRWSPPEQKAQPPSLDDGPLPVSSTQPTSLDIRAWSRATYSSSTVRGRNAFRTSGRLKATRTVPESTPRCEVMSVNVTPSTGRQRSVSKISEIMPPIVADPPAGTCGQVPFLNRDAIYTPESWFAGVSQIREAQDSGLLRGQGRMSVQKTEARQPRRRDGDSRGDVDRRHERRSRGRAAAGLRAAGGHRRA